MKLFLASALVALSAKNASAFRIVQTRDDTYCVMVVPNDGSWAAADLLTTPTTVLTNGDDGPTVGPNGVNDPNGNILAAAQSAWAGGAYSGFTLYGGDGTTALTVPPQNGDTLFPATLGFCKLYSTQAPSHYCKGDGAYDPWQQSNWGDSIDECCQNNHAAEYNECFKVSAGVPRTANAGNWYADHQNKVCKRECDVNNLFKPTDLTNQWVSGTTDVGGSIFQSYECGGLLSYPTPTVSVFADAASCCADAYGDQNSNYCEHQSTLGLAPAPAPAYPGTKEWYGNSALGICVPDCPTGSFLDLLDPSGPTVVPAATNGNEIPCGGVVKDAFTKLYATSAACCTGSNVGPDDFTCTARSDVGDGVATGEYFAGSDGCYSDCTGSPNCQTAPKSSTLYASAGDCCDKHFSWVKKDYCTTRANPTFVTSAASPGGTNLWYVDWQNGVCKQDCFNTVAGCDYAPSGGLDLGWYSSAEDCCKNKLPSVQACQQASEEGTALDNTATLEFYVTGNYDQPCAPDCPSGSFLDPSGPTVVTVAVGNEIPCGGIKAKNGDKFYPDATTCCKTAFSWVNEDLCVTKSNDPNGHTNDWYVSYQDNTCHQDCDPTAGGAAASCKGSPDDLSTPLYADEATCCARMGWVDANTCEANSLAGTSSSSAAGSGPGTGEWRKNDGYSQCVLDCTAGDTITAGDPIITVNPLVNPITNDPPEWTNLPLSDGDTYPPQCDGIAGPAGSWQTLYSNDLTSCCKSLPASIQLETCQALSLDEVSQMFFLNPSDRSTCVAHQAVSVTGTYIACDGNGKVSGGSAGSSVTGVTCNPTIDQNTKLYSTLAECCEANVSWDKTNCEYKSQGVSAPGTSDYYVDWSLSQCVQNCPESSGPSCGGVANAWETLYPTSTACADRISWVPKADAIYVAP